METTKQIHKVVKIHEDDREEILSTHDILNDAYAALGKAVFTDAQNREIAGDTSETYKNIGFQIHTYNIDLN